MNKVTHKETQRDTTAMQVYSLLFFMFELGYNLVESKKGYVFENSLPYHKHFPFLSFQRAVKWHNSPLTILHLPDEYKVSGYALNRAISAKFLDRVHLSLKGCKLHTNFHWVKFCNQSYETFKDDLYSLPHLGEES